MHLCLQAAAVRYVPHSIAASRQTIKPEARGTVAVAVVAVFEIELRMKSTFGGERGDGGVEQWGRALGGGGRCC